MDDEAEVSEVDRVVARGQTIAGLRAQNKTGQVRVLSEDLGIPRSSGGGLAFFGDMDAEAGGRQRLSIDELVRLIRVLAEV